MNGQQPLRVHLPAKPVSFTDQHRVELKKHMRNGWQADALCDSVADDLWFASTIQTESKAAAISLCARCPVRRSCLAFALAGDESEGIWGGTTAMQRWAMRIDLLNGIPVADALDSATVRPTHLWLH